ncbi:MAG: CDP-alcohol phosphatidyltransferase family protein, partial [Clostridia bacterium]|nr:CDP-alcohol phosphatidyltransferase family protein [Clostridia bacterium]
MNLPNKLTIIRIILIPIFVAVFYIPQIPYNYVISAFIFALAAFTDFLDGHIARKYNLVTDLGKFLDPIADKVLVSTA